MPDTTRDGHLMKPGNLPEIMPGPEDTYQSYGYGWPTSNTPFQLFKQHDHEGGTKTPLIVHWPGVVEPGSITGQIAHVIDLAPTFLDVAGINHPTHFGDRPVVRMDGKTLLVVFEGERRQSHHAVFWEWKYGRTARSERWKLVRVDDEPWELYDIDAGGTELKNLSGENLVMVERLEKLWNAWKGRPLDDRLKWVWAGPWRPVLLPADAKSAEELQTRLDIRPATSSPCLP